MTQLDHYLVHIYCPVAKGTKENCEKMRDTLIERGRGNPANQAKYFKVVSIQEWDKIQENAEKVAKDSSSVIQFNQQVEVPKCSTFYAKVSQLFFWFCSLFQ